MSAPHENVLVVRRTLFDQLGSFHGLNFEPQRYLDAILARGNNYFLARATAENDPTHKQIIPYAVLACGDRVLHYVRGKKAGEQRLVAKGSIGIGGHMNDEDESLFAWDEQAYHLENDPEGRLFSEILVDVVAAEVIEPWGGGKWHLEVFRSTNPEPEDWNGEM